jgi:prevent-host-death family protein
MDDNGSIEPSGSLGELLDRAERGEQITIMRNGEPVARLVPTGRAFDRADALRAKDAVASIRNGLSLDGLRFKDLIHEGHKY